MKISTHNDWDPLKEIIVGRADGACIPTVDPSTMSFSYAGNSIQEIKKIEGPLPQSIVDEANEDIEELVSTLKAFGVKVHRPEIPTPEKLISTPDWTSTGYYTWCPRDLLLPLDNLIIDCPSPMRARYYENRAYQNILMEALEDDVEWIAAPKPRLIDESFCFDDLSKPTLKNLEPVFDAPNIVRLGKDLLFQISNSGNLLGYKWLKTILEPRGYTLHLAEEIYSFAHFDSTVIPLRPGLVLLNGTRVDKYNCPKIFEKWDKIYFSDVANTSECSEMGVLPCSPYIGLNILSINPSTVCVDIEQTALIKKLAQYGIESIPLPMRHARKLSGGFHCATLDLVRDGSLESYN